MKPELLITMSGTKDTILSECLGIQSDRADYLFSSCTDALIECKNLADSLVAISKIADNANELAYLIITLHTLHDKMINNPIYQLLIGLRDAIGTKSSTKAAKTVVVTSETKGSLGVDDLIAGLQED